MRKRRQYQSEMVYDYSKYLETMDLHDLDASMTRTERPRKRDIDRMMEWKKMVGRRRIGVHLAREVCYEQVWMDESHSHRGACRVELAWGSSPTNDV